MLRARTGPRIIALLLPFWGAITLVLLQVQPLLPQPPDTILINEADAETPGTDTAEFVELYDGGSGYTDLDGLIIVFFNGQDDRSYRTFDLTGYQTNSEGFFLLGNESVADVDLVFADNILQNGPDAVALYYGQASDFPAGTAVTDKNLQDALVYDSDDPDDPGLLALLVEGEPQIDENGKDLAEFHANQRCPDGAGGQRRTSGYIQDLPSPKSANNCPAISDDAPYVMSTVPAADALDVATDADININFSEAVTLSETWYDIACSLSGGHSAVVSGNETTFTLDPASHFIASENCTITLFGALISDVDTQDPPDQMSADYSWSFTVDETAAASHIIINEIDVDTPGSDTAEFIELFDGGAGSTSLDGLVVVLFNGSADTSYRAIDLDGYRTDTQGYFVIGNADATNVELLIPDGSVQNGADAIALYEANESDFPNGTGVSTAALLDAIVYDTDDADDAGLLDLLNASQPQVNEASRGNGPLDSNQRCPNGGGGQRNTTAYRQNLPTAGAANKCTYDNPPQVVETSPADGQQAIAENAALTITFSEAVVVSDAAFSLRCDASGSHNLVTSGGPTQFTVTPAAVFTPGESCSAKVLAREVSDQDVDDPPDGMVDDYTWAFKIKSLPVATEMLINEVDADTPGIDTAEFVELYDGGSGHTRLDGLVLVFFNGNDDTSYRAVDLDGFSTSPSGYFVAGGSDVTGVDLILPNGSIQNGADAIALYAADSADFPNGSAVTRSGLVDALVYDTNDEDDTGLLVLLNAGEPQVDEAARSNKDYDSNQRCPNGQGGQRNSNGYRQNLPTPSSSNACMLDNPPSVKGTTPTDGASEVANDANLTVRFSEAVAVSEGWFNIACSQSLVHAATQSGGPSSFTLNPHDNFASGERCIVTLFADQIRDLDGLAQQMDADYIFSFGTGAPLFGACGDPATPINMIQGSGITSPLLGAESVIVEGMVTATFLGEDALEGLFMQEERDEQDSITQTSEGIFIDGTDLVDAVNVGDIVRLQGTVSEQAGLTTLTDLIALQSCGKRAELMPQQLTLPVPSMLAWESFEGMLVTIAQKMSVTSSAELGSTGSIDLALNNRLFAPTEMVEPGEQARALADLNERSRIKLDDGRRGAPILPLPVYLGPDKTLRIGDSLQEIVGIVTEDAGDYRIQPTEQVIFSRENPRPSLGPPGENRLRAVLFDTGGYFNGDGHGAGFPGAGGAATAEEFTRQRAKIVNALLSMEPHVVGLLSLENDGYGRESAIQDLVNGLNDKALDGKTFAFVDPLLPKLGDSVIAVGMIYRSDILIPQGAARILNRDPFNANNVKPLFQSFAIREGGKEFVLALTHFHDREQCPAPGDPNGDKNDGQDCWNAERVLAAETLVEFLDSNLAATGNAQFLVMGNLNAYAQEDPLTSFKNAGFANLDSRTIGRGYTTVTSGETNTILHAWASSQLAASVTKIEQWHINADEPALLDYRTTNPPLLYVPDVFRSAAHDPILVEFDTRIVVPVFLPIILATSST